MKIGKSFNSVNRITKKNRISIDQDDDNQFQLLKKFFNMSRLTDYVELTKTGAGYHITGEFKDRTLQQNLAVRRTLGDCKGRLDLDDDRLNAGLGEFYAEILFYEKVHNGNITGEEKFNIMSMPFWGNGLKWRKRA